MLATLNLGAVIFGVGAGGLVASLIALTLSAGLTLVGFEDGAAAGLIIGVVVGLAAGGWIAGWRAPHTHRFHGMVTGLLLAFMIVFIARIRGSQASIWVIAWQVILAIAVAGTSGWLAGRWKAGRG